MALFKRGILGVDIGTSKISMTTDGKGVCLSEPSVVVLKKSGRKNKVHAVGQEAFKMIGRVADDMPVVWPMKDGVIADAELVEALLRDLAGKALGSSRALSGLNVMVCTSQDATRVEKQATWQAVGAAGARRVLTVTSTMAAAVGAGLPVEHPKGCFIMDIGGGITEIALLSLGGVVASRSVRAGGHAMDQAIVDYMRIKHNLLIGVKTAEEIKLDIGTAVMPNEGDMMDHALLRGRDTVSGLPQGVEIDSSDICKALDVPLKRILSTMQGVLESMPPELAQDLMENGLHVTGGGALLSGLDVFLSEEIGMPVYIAQGAQDCATLGAGRLAADQELLALALRAGTVED